MCVVKVEDIFVVLDGQGGQELDDYVSFQFVQETVEKVTALSPIFVIAIIDKWLHHVK